jgi:hypothetical protein
MESTRCLITVISFLGHEYFNQLQDYLTTSQILLLTNLLQK